MTEAKKLVWCQLWTIQENKPGKIQGEFCTLHQNERARQRFIDEYWRRMPKRDLDQYGAPTLQSAMKGGKVLFQCAVDDHTYQSVIQSSHGIWSATVPMDSIETVTTIPAEDLTPFTEGLVA